MKSKTNLLVVDVGNTATNFGIFDCASSTLRPQPQKIWTLSTSSLKHLGRRNFSFRGIVADIMVSSVVPSVDVPLSRSLKKYFGVWPRFVTGRTQTQVKIRYQHPAEVGADRIVNARAVMEIWKGPSIVVDFGTATTFDCVTAKGEYLGGVIAPGPVISAEALYQKTAKLPLVLLKEPAAILGRTTLHSIQAGLYHGYRGLVKEIIFHLRKKMGPRTGVFSTGGQARWILKGLGIINENIPHLTLMGLYYVWQDLNSNKRKETP